MRKLWLLLLPLLWLLPSLQSFPYSSAQAAYSDLVISHLPNALFLRQALLEGHTLPFWSPGILSGYPFAANPLSGLWYPPGWLALLLPLPLGFNLLVALHLLWGGLGMVRLLRAEGLAYPAALLGGLAFEAMPKLFAHYGAGHLTLLYAVPWTPWLLLACHGASARYNMARSPVHVSRILQPGVILALIFLADPRWAAFAGATWLAYSLAGRLKHSAPTLPLSTFSLQLLFQLVLAALLAAPLALPLLEFTRLSTRSQMTSGDIYLFSLPPARLLGLVFPDFGGPHEWMMYPGVLILALALLAIGRKAVRRCVGFWAGALGLSLVFSLGSFLPFLTFLARLPGFDLLRVPSRGLFLTGLCLAALAAYALNDLLDAPVREDRSGLLLASLGSFALVLTGGFWSITGKIPLSFAWGAGFTLMGVVWIGLQLGRRMPAQTWMAGILVLCMLDWTVVNRAAFAPRSAGQVYAEQERMASWLSSQPGLFRIYSPSYSLPQQTATRYSLELADGIDPLQLRSYASFMQRASGVPPTGYSVTLPPFVNGEPERDNAAYHPDPALLGLLNVRYVLADYNLSQEGLALQGRFGKTRVYENDDYLPRAWLQPADLPPGEQAQPVEIGRWSPNQLELSAEVIGQTKLLVLSELVYPGWQARVDGEPAQIQVVADLLRGIRLQPGKHQITFDFCPLTVYTGLGLWALGVLLAAWQISGRNG